MEMDCAPERRFRAHLLGHGEGLLEELVQRRAQGPRALGGPDRLLDLSQDLRLADHHGVEAASDPERVLHRRLVACE
jgi:hypothetical protein